MAKGLTIMAIVVAILLFALFSLDLATSIPFRRAAVGLDIVFVLSSLGLGYLGWTTLRDLR
jgi:hypothetical protein